MMLRSLASTVLVSGAALFLACSSDSNATSSSSSSSSSGSSGTSTPISAADCQKRCEAKLISSCQAPADQAKAGCTQVCSGSLTEAQVTCLEGKSCEEIGRADSMEKLCPASTSSTSSSGTSGTSGTSSSGTSGTSGGNPTDLTITGTFASSTKAIHVSGSNNTIASNISVAPKPSFSPSQPSQLPNVADKGVTYTVTSPSLGTCKPNISFVLNSNQIGVSVTAQDTLPATDCATFTDKFASDGFKATLKDVPYPNSTTKATVTIDVHP